MNDALSIQIGGDHYRKLAIQPAEYILANGVPWAEGCVIGYLTRWRDKGGIVDIDKAIHTVQLLRDAVVAGKVLEPPAHPRDCRLVYLGTPYSKYPGGIDKAFRDAAALAGRLVAAGIRVYSPIAHTHPLAIHGGLDPMSHDIWLPFDEAMMDVCDALLITHMEGWAESHGLRHEFDVFHAAGKPIFDLDPETLATIKRGG